MTRRRFSFPGALLASAVVIVACAKAEDSDLVGPGHPSTGGTGGSAGRAGAAGTSALSGSGGMAQGKGGAGGASAGKGGAGGGSGTGGQKSTGGAGGKSSALGCDVPGEGGAAGAAGEAGAGGAGGAGDGSGSTLFFDDFETGNASRWTPAAGSWSVVTDGSEVYEQGLTENKPQFSMVEGSCFADQVVEARVKVLDFPGSSTSYYVALFARALGPTTHYFLAFDSTGKLSLRKRVNASGNSSTRLGSDKALSPRIDDEEWHTLRLEVVGTRLTAFVDGSEQLSVTDGSIASGGVGVGTLNGMAAFDDVRVTAP